VPPPAVIRRYCLVYAIGLLAAATLPTAAQSPDDSLYSALSADIAKLAPQTIHPAEGAIKYPYLIPAGYYPQMWDWDGFFIGVHWANQDAADAKYLRDWVISFASSADANGYVAGCITPKGPRPLFGKFAMKPFLAQGAYFAAVRLRDFEWIRPAWPAIERIAEYRRKTQFDEKWKLWYWDNAMQSGADNNAALTNDTKDRSAILAVDASEYAMREYLAMGQIAERLGEKETSEKYLQLAIETRKAITAQLWSEKDAMFYNRRRDTGAWVRVMSWSNFLPLVDRLLDAPKAKRMIEGHLLNTDEMRSEYGFRSLAKSDGAYNNEAIIDPYSNWRGPVWINANFLDWIALRRYGYKDEAHQLAVTLAGVLHRDIEKWGSMHEDYSAETGEGLAPTPAQSPGGKFAGFVGWNLLAQDMLGCETGRGRCVRFGVGW
jgi:alpha,alpha-trehalase